jgi:outer membrane usher protein
VLAVNQELGSSKSMTLSAYSQNYWNRPGYDRSFQVAFGLRVGPASVGVSLARSLPAPGTIASTRALVTLSMPLGRGTSWTTTSQLVRDSGVGSSLQAGASGTLGDDNEYGININGSRDAAGAGSASLGGSYRGSAMTVSGSLTRAGGILQTAFTADGGLVAHGGGVTFSSTLGDSVGLVYAPSAPGASVLGAPGSEVNSSGYAIVPYLTPYNLNSIELDMKNAPLDTQLDTTVEQAVPRAGAVVRIDFKGRRGRNVLIEARADDGKALPFSATVLDESGRAVGLVGQGGRIEANVAEDAGRLTVRWGDEPSDQCTLSYRLPAPDGHKAVDFARTEAVCRQAQGAMYPQTSLNEGTR